MGIQRGPTCRVEGEKESHFGNHEILAKMEQIETSPFNLNFDGIYLINQRCMRLL